MGIMAAVCVTVKKVIKVPNVKYQQQNVKYLVVRDMDVVLKVNAIVNAATKETTAPNVSKFKINVLTIFFYFQLSN